MNHPRTKESITAAIISSADSIKNNAVILAEIMMRQNQPALSLHFTNYACGFESEFISSFFPAGYEGCVLKHSSQIKHAIAHLLGIEVNCFSSDEIKSILDKVIT